MFLWRQDLLHCQGDDVLRQHYRLRFGPHLLYYRPDAIRGDQRENLLREHFLQLQPKLLYDWFHAVLRG